MLEVTLSGQAQELEGNLVSGNYILVNKTKSKDDYSWKKDDDNLFIIRTILEIPTFIVCSAEAKESIMSNTQLLYKQDFCYNTFSILVFDYSHLNRF